MGQLPNQLDANLRILDSLQLQLASNQEAQRRTSDRIMFLEREMSRLEGQISGAASITNSAGEQQPVTNTTLNQLVGERDLLRQRVSNMESKYTNRHPDLIAARKEGVPHLVFWLHRPIAIRDRHRITDSRLLNFVRRPCVHKYTGV